MFCRNRTQFVCGAIRLQDEPLKDVYPIIVCTLSGARMLYFIDR